MATESVAGRKVRHVCAVCGSENVYRDASAKWSVQFQRYIVESVDDDAFCEDCDDDTVIRERPL